jgi:hypothetical protein
MDPTQVINKRVEVAVFFRKDCDVSMLAYPVKMKYQNQEIRFTRLGLRHTTAKGKRMIHVFDVTDEVNDYRLEFDAEGLTWTLVAIIPGVSL